MEIIGTVYTLNAVCKRLGKSRAALKQAIFQLRKAGQPLEIGEFRFVLVGSTYIAVNKDEDLIVIDD